jgi:hypothetical protein
MPKNRPEQLALFIVPAETRVDRGIGSIDNKTEEEVMADIYQPVELVMTFPPGELEEMRRLLQ